MNISDNIDRLLTIVHDANEAVLAVYHSDFNVEIKQDHSPLTQADKASHVIVMDGLRSLTPDIPVVSEEGDREYNEQTVTADKFWLVDPLDGTREFVARNGQFCVAMALIEGGVPTFGMFSIPTMNVVYYGGKAIGSYKIVNDATEAIHVSAQPTNIVLGSRIDTGGPTGEYITRHYGGYELQSYGSMLKFGMIAEGKADAYPCVQRPLKLWDIAAGQALLEGAGGSLMRPDGTPVDYNNPTLLAGDFVASSNS
jgi:3'(2'), 5'-bisphosphate nucleotidase